MWESKKGLDHLNNVGLLNVREGVEYVENWGKFERIKYFPGFGDNLTILVVSFRWVNTKAEK